MDIPIYFNNEIIVSNFKEIFLNKKYLKNTKIKFLHLGAYTGHATKWVLENTNAYAIDVDTWEGSSGKEGHLDNHENFYSKEIEGIHDNLLDGLPVIKFKGKTKDFFAKNSKKFNFIYIDASHKKADVELDLVESFKILDIGGIIACDDYLWCTPNDPWQNPVGDPELIPHHAINEFISNNFDKVEILINNYQFWFKKNSS